MERFNTCGPINYVPDGLGMYYADYLAKLAEIRAAVEAERDAWLTLYEAARDGALPRSPENHMTNAQGVAEFALDALLSEAE